MGISAKLTCPTEVFLGDWAHFNRENGTKRKKTIARFFQYDGEFRGVCLCLRDHRNFQMPP